MTRIATMDEDAVCGETWPPRTTIEDPHFDPIASTTMAHDDLRHRPYRVARLGYFDDTKSPAEIARAQPALHCNIMIDQSIRATSQSIKVNLHHRQRLPLSWLFTLAAGGDTRSKLDHGCSPRAANRSQKNDNDRAHSRTSPHQRQTLQPQNDFEESRGSASLGIVPPLNVRWPARLRRICQNTSWGTHGSPDCNRADFPF
ncbi:uncharacterized protein SEPMUDRAFT_114617 [Sphaerulina musiva SO2202]|uniref:Uncharacterized protein n=1 Tax=Sphaerulina musiva (strain SO2202) TaxID=692275 RepID=M3DBU0_SPHMS|nr:uncharacterized protein SEPMUDRAFT_114617 [Sphaerulina musiva SO2202]EMF15525.1 hypothetical protein SEPMUDRAFT_114617 [Sphaerulina musiva SO2202]